MSNQIPERGISMSAPMIRSYLAGLKGCTRRLLNPQPSSYTVSMEFSDFGWSSRFRADLRLPDILSHQAYHKCPCGAPGDELYFKEALGRRPASFLGIEATNGVESAFYQATPQEEVVNEHDFNLCPWWKGKTLSPRFMPRHASRFRHIPITDIRVERLGDISEQDALDEGIENWCPFGICGGNGFIPTGNTSLAPDDCKCADVGAVEIFRFLWESIHGPGSWERDKSLFVWVIFFPKHKN